MNLQDLLVLVDAVDEDGNHVARKGEMLTMMDPSGRSNQQYPIEMVFLEDDCVFISLLGIEDSTCYDVDSFDEEITVWAEVLTC